VIARRVVLGLGAGFVAALALAGCGGEAEPVATAPLPTASAPAAGAPGAPAAGAPGAPAAAPEAAAPDAGAPAGAPAADQPAATGRSAVAAPPFAEPGDIVTVTGSGWPAGNLVTASLCGNNFLNGSVDCDQSGAGQVIAGPDGAFGIQITVALPPKPCPCVVHVATQADTGTVDIPFEIPGAPTAPPSQLLITRSVDVVSSITGSGPLSAYFGGQAQRELVLTLTNTGNQALENLPLNLTVGKGQDPTTPLTSPDGLPLQIPRIEAGASVEVRQPFTIDAPAFGQYTVKGSFVGLDSITVDGERQANAGDLSFRSTTSTYPWALIVIGWLLLQIPLLGLYKRRPVVVEPAATEDPYADQLAVAEPMPVTEGFAGGVFEPVGAGAAVTAVAAGAAATAPPPPPPGFQVLPPPPAPPAAAAPVAAAAAAAPQAAASPVFGVNDLRAMFDQSEASTAPSDPANPTI
jgi:hypothetical protein